MRSEYFTVLNSLRGAAFAPISSKYLVQVKVAWSYPNKKKTISIYLTQFSILRI